MASGVPYQSTPRSTAVWPPPTRWSALYPLLTRLGWLPGHLAEDFPEVSFPIGQLDGIANRCAGQLYHGERTRITWTNNEIVLPTIAGSKASGIVVRVAGITGRVRGMKYKRPDGRSVRPSLVIIDDPQTNESAGSLEQTRKRIRVLAAQPDARWAIAK